MVLVNSEKNVFRTNGAHRNGRVFLFFLCLSPLINNTALGATAIPTAHDERQKLDYSILNAQIIIIHCMFVFLLVHGIV
jgi:hypothetical protein